MIIRYNLYVVGKAKGKDARIGEILMEQLFPEQLYEIIEKIIDIYTREDKKKEPNFKFVNRYGIEKLKFLYLNFHRLYAYYTLLIIY